MDSKTASIDKASPVPMYHQLKRIIKSEIEEGKLQPGQPIPTEVELMDMFNISRTTVRLAIADMVKDELLYRVRAKGTYVAQKKVELGYMQRIEPFHDQILRSGKRPRTCVLFSGIAEVSDDVLAHLQLSSDSKVIYIKRLRYIDDVPAVIVESYHPHAACKRLLTVDLERVSLYETLAQDEHTRVRTIDRTLEARVASPQEAELLAVKKGFPLLSFVTESRAADGTIVEYCFSQYRGDKLKVSSHIQV